MKKLVRHAGTSPRLVFVSKDAYSAALLGGLTVGDPVLRSGKPLSVELGPGIVISSSATGL